MRFILNLLGYIVGGSFAAAVGFVTYLYYRFRFILLVLLPLAYQAINWPDLMNRDSNAIFMLIPPIFYVYTKIKGSSKKKAKNTAPSIDKKYSESDSTGVFVKINPSYFRDLQTQAKRNRNQLIVARRQGIVIGSIVSLFIFGMLIIGTKEYDSGKTVDKIDYSHHMTVDEQMRWTKAIQEYALKKMQAGKKKLP